MMNPYEELGAHRLIVHNLTFIEELQHPTSDTASDIRCTFVDFFRADNNIQPVSTPSL